MACTIKVPYEKWNPETCEYELAGYNDLPAKVFAESAILNGVDVNSFHASLNSFSESSRSSLPQIQAWRDEATDIYVNEMVKQGKIKVPKPEEVFEGGSDYEEDNGAAPDVDKTNNK